MSSTASNDKNMEPSSVKEEPVRVNVKDNKDSKVGHLYTPLMAIQPQAPLLTKYEQNESRPKPAHKRRPRGKKQATVDGENVNPTETNKTKLSSKKSDEGLAHGSTRASSKVEKKYPIDDAPEYEQNVPTPALTVSHPEATLSATSSQDASQSEPAGASSSLPQVPKASLPYPTLFAEASRMCVDCVKLLTSDPNHRCHREIKLHNCERCVHLNKNCISLPRPLQSTVARLLKNRADADFGQQVEGVIDELEVYAYGRHDEDQDETLHLLRSINRNLSRIANLLKVAADGEEHSEEEAEVDEGVFGV